MEIWIELKNVYGWRRVVAHKDLRDKIWNFEKWLQASVRKQIKIALNEAEVKGFHGRFKPQRR
jgi:hypothetical protein